MGGAAQSFSSNPSPLPVAAALEPLPEKPFGSATGETPFSAPVSARTPRSDAVPSAANVEDGAASSSKQHSRQLSRQPSPAVENDVESDLKPLATDAVPSSGSTALANAAVANRAVKSPDVASNASAPSDKGCAGAAGTPQSSPPRQAR